MEGGHGHGYSIKRPKPGDSEEDILAEEMEFLANLKSGVGVRPAAKVVKSNPQETSNKGGYSHPTGGDESTGIETNKRKKDTSTINSGAVSMELEHPTEQVLFSIKEKDFDPAKLRSFTGMKVLSKIPVEGTVEINKAESKQRKKSLFARSFDAVQARQSNSQMGNEVDTKIQDGNLLTKGETIGDKIHPALVGMTEADILAEQKKLKELLDPKIVEFVRTMKQSKQTKTVPQTEAQSSVWPNSMNISSETTVSQPTVDYDDLPINPQDVSKFPGMTRIEHDKLAWTGVVKPVQQCNTNSTAPNNSVDEAEKNARFDFLGNIVIDGKLPETETFNKALHCHGEEMERAGYTLAELLTLVRSTNAIQRCMGLDTIGNIFEKAHTGLFDVYLKTSIFHALKEMDFVHAIRVALDYTDATSVNAAFKCLAELVYPTHDETCLDIVYLWYYSRPYPLLVTNPGGSDFVGRDDKDVEILENDILQFLVKRSDLLARIAYIFRAKSNILSEVGVNSILKILIRVARHSPNDLMGFPNLMEHVVRNHVSADWKLIGTRPPSLRGVPLPLAYKVLRILVDSSAKNAETVFAQFDIFPHLMSYLAYFEWKDQNLVLDHENLILECFKTWIAFLSHGLAIDEYSSFFPILMQFLRYYELAINFSSFDLAHVSHIFKLMQSVLEISDREDIEISHSHWPLVKVGLQFVETFVEKMFSILTSDTELSNEYNHDLALLSLAQGLSFLIASAKCQDSINPSLQRSISSFLKSTYYDLETTRLMTHSMLFLKEKSENQRYPSNFANTMATLYGGKLNPVILTGSPFNFMTELVRYVKMKKNFGQDLIVNVHIKKYLQELRKYKSSEHCSFFVRFEVGLMCELMELYPDVAERFTLAYKLLSEVPVCCVNLHTKLLRQIFTSCRVDDSEFAVLTHLYSKSVATITDEAKCPSEEKKVRFDEKTLIECEKVSNRRLTMFAKWDTKLTKQYWIFEPLDDLRKTAIKSVCFTENNLNMVEDQTRAILRFIRTCLVEFSDTLLANVQDYVMVYSRIGQIFLLGDPRIYIDEINSQMLRDIYNVLINAAIIANNTERPIFSTLIPTAELNTSFFDIYTDFVREYEDNSYYNELFASFLLLPLRPAEDSRVKKTFWTSDCIRSIRFSSLNAPVPTSWFTSIMETDVEIANLFFQIFKSQRVTKNRNPLLFDIIKFQLTPHLNKMGESFRADFEMLEL